MKKCKNCGYETNNEGSFCPNCGAQSLVDVYVTPPVSPTSPLIACPNCGERITDFKITFCGNCGHKLPKLTPPAPIIPQTPDLKKKKSNKLIAVAAVAVLLVIAIAAGLFLMSKTSAPIVKVAGGLSEVLTSGETFDISFSMKEYYDSELYDEITADGLISIDPEKKTAVAEGTLFDSYDNIDAFGYISGEDEKVILQTGMDGNVVGIINDIMFRSDGNNGYDYEKNSGFTSFILEIANGVFEALNSSTDITSFNIEELKQILLPFLEEMDIPEEIVDLIIEAVEVIKNDVINAFTSTSWYKEYLGYSKSGGAMTFKFTLDEPLEGLFKIVEDNEKELQSILNEASEILGEDAPEISELLDDIRGDFDEASEFKVDLTIELDGSYLSLIDFTVKNDDEKFTLLLEIKKTNDKINVDFEKFDEIESGYTASASTNPYLYY